MTPLRCPANHTVFLFTGGSNQVVEHQADFLSASCPRYVVPDHATETVGFHRRHSAQQVLNQRATNGEGVFVVEAERREFVTLAAEISRLDSEPATGSYYATVKPHALLTLPALVAGLALLTGRLPFNLGVPGLRALILVGCLRRCPRPDARKFGQ